MDKFKPEHLHNLETLANFLENDIEDSQFNIEYYRSDGSRELNVKSISLRYCGTQGCALGWAAHAFNMTDMCMPRFTDGDINWGGVCVEIFGEEWYEFDLIELNEYVNKSQQLGYIFSNKGEDKTRLGAVKRIREVIELNKGE